MPATELLELTIRAGIAAVVSLPVGTAGNVLAVLSVGVRDPYDLTRGLTRTLDRVAAELASFFSLRQSQLAPRALTPRELEVLQFAADGQKAAAIAQLLSVGESTVKTHFDNAYRKLGVSDRAAAVAEALRQGYIV